ncbi:MAG: hypothetical protein AABY03_01390 [Nanoarchaeota archaeon]
MHLRRDFRGQLTIFVIIAIVLIATVALFFAIRGNIFVSEIPASLEPVYTTFISCLEEDTLVGIDTLESQGGYIQLPDFSPGSDFMPFSSQLDFLGNPIPYWYYVSGNNIPREQIPTKNEMEEQLSDFVEEKIRNCVFDSYYDDGFEIFIDEGEASARILNGRIDISLNADLTIRKGDESVVISNHDVSINSEFNSLYDSARDVYDFEQESLFLENYGIDTLRLYAPVDGVELTCSPLTWNAFEIYNNLTTAIEGNTFAINAKDEKYFDLQLPVKYEVRFVNSRNWSNAFEVNPSQEYFLISSPVGTQPGLGVLGFCYVPYHFVYDVKYPVLIQISGEGETFQFPMAVVIAGNKPRESLETDAVLVGLPELCEQKNALTEVRVFDSEFGNIDADVSYECSGTVCLIGKTENGIIKTNFPQCVNGFVIARTENYEESKEQYSAIQDGSVDVFLEKLYEKNVELKLNGQNYNGQATINFAKDDGNSKVVVYPEQRTVKLSEGQYEIQVHAYRNTTLNIGATTSKTCVEIPASGVGGFFGFTKENCYNIEFPAQIVSNALAGGGTQNYYILESELQGLNAIEISGESLPVPDSINQLQENYILFDDKKLSIIFK